MTDTAYNLLCAFGVTYLIVGSSIFAPFRIMLARRFVVGELFFYCAYCVGFWAGIGAYAAGHFMLSWSALCQSVEMGMVVMGAIALTRAPWPSFLAGAYEHEREHLGRSERGADGADD